MYVCRNNLNVLLSKLYINDPVNEDIQGIFGFFTFGITK